MNKITGNEESGLITRLKNSFSGIQHAWWGERSFRAQFVVALATLSFFTWWGLPTCWWALIVLLIALPLEAKLMNSDIEALSDHLHPEHHPVIGRIKDMTAGTVLVMSTAALIVGALAVAVTL